MAPPFLAKFALFMAMASFMANAGDPNLLQDFCVSSFDPNNTLFVNGFMCKNPADVTIDDFVYTGFNVAGDTNNQDGSANKVLTPENLPGLNTLGVSVVRLDYAAGGLAPLHTHHRSTEVLTVLEGTLYAGFVTSIDTGYKLYAKVLNAGDVMVIPQGLIVHFQLNVGTTKAAALSAASSQVPSNNRLGNAVFAADPPIRADVIAKSFQLDEEIVKEIQSKTFLGKKNNY